MKLRVPVSFLFIPAGFCGMFAIIAGGVAFSQRPYADWTVCLWLLAGLAACGAVYLIKFTGVVDWIPDEELVAMEKAERKQEFDKEVDALVEAAQDGTLEAKYRVQRRWHYAFLTVVILLMFHAYTIYDVKMASGERGLSMLGLTFGTWRLFRRSWTGVELLSVGSCLVALVYYLRKGTARLKRANERRAP